MKKLIPSSSLLRGAVETLRRGGIVAHPTDTCYGLAVDIHNPSALHHLYKAKGMELSKPVSILVSSLEVAREYGEFSNLALRLAHRFWPGALALVLPRTPALPAFLNPGEPFVGIRLIDEPFSVALLKSWGDVLTTTSANFHGKPSPYSPQDISLEVDFLMDAGSIPVRMPSTILRVDHDRVEKLRSGDLDLVLTEFLRQEGVRLEF